MIANQVFFQIFRLNRLLINRQGPFSAVKTVAAILAIGSIIAGCTTVQKSYICTPQQEARLNIAKAQTTKDIQRFRSSLSNVHLKINQDECRRTLFSRPLDSNKCESYKMQTEKLKSAIRKHQERLHEINAALNGRLHKEDHVKSCSPTWLSSPVRQIRKAPKRLPAVKKKQSVTPVKATEKLVPDIVVEPPTPLPTDPAHMPLPENESENKNTPVELPFYKARPKSEPTIEEKSVQLERSYIPDPNIRVVGPTFFADQSEPEDPPFRAHEPDQ